jgi:saccharopine dehydrogenase-like NADP-dependent oxidoreductase
MTGQSVLIAGGYGVVGRRVAAHLARDYRVLIAGRHQAQANIVAAGIGHHAVGREIDVTNGRSIAAALDGVTAVVSCIDQPQRLLLHAAIERGLAYTDITPHLVELGRAEAYDDLCIASKRSGARVVLGTGIVPGISNVIVRALANNLDGAEKIVTSLLLSASDTSGPASLDYFAKELTMPFEVHTDGQDVAAHAFTDPTLIEFPPPFGPRWAYLFPFSDQVLYPRTMGAKTVLTRLSLEPPRLGRLLAVVLRIGAARLLELDRVRRTLVAHRGTSKAGRDEPQFALRVDVAHGTQSASAALVGGAQADAAAIGASSTIRALLEGEITASGVWMPEQVIDPPRFFSRLAEQSLHVQLTAAGSHD